MEELEETELAHALGVTTASQAQAKDTVQQKQEALKNFLVEEKSDQLKAFQNFWTPEISRLFHDDECPTPSKIINDNIKEDKDFIESSDVAKNERDPPGDDYSLERKPKMGRTPELEPRKCDARKIYRCTDCEKTFESKNSLNLHQRSHNDDNYKYFCEECPKKFIMKCTFSAHQETHNPFRVCQVCGSTIATKKAFDRHVQRCTNNFKHKCEACSKGFLSRNKLVEHIRTHTKDRPFECDECGSKFGRESGLLSHKRRHAGIKPYQCKLCSFAGYDSADVAHHRQRAHPDASPSKLQLELKRQKAM